MKTQTFSPSIQPDQLPAFAQAFWALGHPVRLQIFFFLATQGEQGAKVSEIRAQVGIPASTLSHHLDVLRQAELLFSTRHQQWICSRVNPDMTRDLVRLLTDCC